VVEVGLDLVLVDGVNDWLLADFYKKGIERLGATIQGDYQTPEVDSLVSMTIKTRFHLS